MCRRREEEEPQMLKLDVQQSRKRRHILVGINPHALHYPKKV